MLLNYFEYICPLVCFVVCVLHSIVEGFLVSKQNKKIDKICDKCLSPVESGVKHECDPEVLQMLESQKLILDHYIEVYKDGNSK